MEKINFFAFFASFVNNLCYFCLVLLCFHARLFVDALRSPAGKGLTSWLSFVMSKCDVVTFPLVSWVRCGAWLYRFLISALFLTFIYPADKAFRIIRTFDFKRAESTCYRTNFTAPFPATKMEHFWYIVLRKMLLTYTRAMIRFSNCGRLSWMPIPRPQKMSRLNRRLS